jgi:aldose 1-epimerase
MNTNLQVSDFGKLPDGRTARLFTMTNRHGMLAKVTNYGTIITELHVPDRKGNPGDVVLGFDALEPYLKGHPFFGATVGRVANRIAKGKFTLEGVTYELAVNNGPNHLHGGLQGFDKKLWDAQPLESGAVKFSYTSPDGEEAYPGNLSVDVTMSLSDADELTIDYQATTDRGTLINLTNHSFFNLAGAGDILAHDLMVSADFYTAADENLIPTGEVLPVRGTPLDFTTPKPIGSRFDQLRGPAPGYDHNYVINRAGKGLALAARCYEAGSGRVMEVHTTQPGVQLYTGNFLDGSLVGKRGVVYQRHAGFCLETQHYPDSIHHPEFPSTILRRGQAFHHVTAFKFLTR